jgi:hypothetical protein
MSIHHTIVLLLLYANFGAYLIAYCVFIAKPHPEGVVSILSDSLGRFLSYILVAIIAYVDFGAGLLLGMCVTCTCAEIDALLHVAKSNI